MNSVAAVHVMVVIALLAGTPEGKEVTDRAAVPHALASMPFLFVEGEAGMPGLVMAHPAHNYGTPDHAYRRLTEIMSHRRADIVSSIWICRANQMATLKRFAPLVNTIAINPFVYPSNKRPTAGDPCWPGFDHPYINRIREIRTAARGKRLLGGIRLDRDLPPKGGRQKHRTSFEEVQWKLYAVIGAGFRGVVWRWESKDAVFFFDRVKRLENQLKPYVKDLGAARLVNWVKGPSEQPVSATVSDRRLFVILLSPYFMTVGKDGNTVRHPLGTSLREGELRILLPAGRTIASGATLAGIAVELSAQGQTARVRYRFRTPGEILVLRLKSASPETRRSDRQLSTQAAGGSRR